MTNESDGIIVYGNLMVEDDIGYSGYRVYSIDAVCPTICASGFKRDIYVLEVVKDED